MTPDRFRELALDLPGTSESGTKTHPNFVVDGTVYASLYSNDGWAVIKMKSELQADLLAEQPTVFEACKGAWGQAGATIVLIEEAEEGSVLRALVSAWEKAAS